MSEQIKNGGPAFPRAAGDYHGTRCGNGAQSGMTLLDYMAAKAMQALASRSSFACDENESARIIARRAYLVADAMLAAREGVSGGQPGPAEISSDIKQANLNLLASKVEELLCMTDIQDEYPILAAELKELAEAVKQ